jgi:hypothetical protein
MPAFAAVVAYRLVRRDPQRSNVFIDADQGPVLHIH